ncbi:ADP-ribose glycohydrolase MACROD2-like isoform X2 [Anarrhichthys ocellatus]|uniref:ADP-ribose glycohydrolase MACROD2-like isoform X2 n=1 Tax=Anarrhichthys ocellatus TaxID=433405 RepID=UPI0012ED2FDF|nr:ADP-ribose glycohydrolase MACROD2-like isoform X2 [Anarrhichthys ocellatus]
MLQKECASLHGCETGDAKITCGYGLPAKYVIHTVGPIAQGGVGEEEKNALRSCYKNSLTTATKNAARSVAFPCISTGVYGYPPEQAVHEALATVREYLDEHHDEVCTRVCVCMIGNFFLPFPQGIIPFTAVVFVFWWERGDGCIEKTHTCTRTVTHTRAHKHTFKHTLQSSGSRAHGQVCVLIGSLRD